MQRIFDKLIATSGNEKPGKLILFNAAGNFTFTGIPFLAKKKQEDEVSRQKIYDQIVMFDFLEHLTTKRNILNQKKNNYDHSI